MSRSCLAFLALAVMALAGCTTGKYAANNAAGQSWLNGHGRSAGISVGGTWYSEEWGGSRLIQTGRNVTGSLGNYDVRGVVSGQQAHLLLYSGRWNYYTAVLARPSPNRLSGFYSSSVPFKPADQRSLELRRVYE